MRTLESSKRLISPDGVEIRYWVNWEKGMGEQFSLIHPGAAMNHSSLAHLEAGLNKRGQPTIIFDPRGSGYSDHPIPLEYFGLDRLSGDLEGIAEQEGLEAPHIVTHSFGFMPGVDYAARTGNVDGITGICASHKFSETAPNKALFHLFDKVLIHSEYLGSFGTKASHYLRGTDRPACADQSHPSSEFDLWLSIVDIPLRKAASHVIGQRECNTWDVTQQLGELETPVLLVYGSKDQMVRPVAGSHIQDRTQSPVRIMTVEGATHSLPIVEPEKVLEAMYE